MRRYLVRAARCGRQPVYYYLLADKERDGRRGYGILVESGEERAEIHRIASSRCRVQSLLKALIRRRVKPVHVRYIVEDWLYVYNL